jgi:hypothetical protein
MFSKTMREGNCIGEVRVVEEGEGRASVPDRT